jgi:prephenate dehydrogenase
MKTYNKICIIGVGLIGGSLGLALKRHKIASHIAGFGRNPSRLKEAKKLGAIDSCHLNLKDAVKDSDIIVIATPVGKIAGFAREVFRYAKKGAIVIDTGSTKSSIVSLIERMKPPGINFVGCHPLAGSEKSGIRHASSNLFNNSHCIIAKTKKTDEVSLKEVLSIWERVKAKVVIMSPDAHDRLLAFISHLPHVLSVALVHTVSSNDFKFAAGGLTDTTRIASSEPIMWRDICLTNKANILKAIDNYKRNLDKIAQHIRTSDASGILREFKRANEKRSIHLR